MVTYVQGGKPVSRVAQRYARALFNLSNKEGSSAQILENLEGFLHILDSHISLQNFLKNPLVPFDRQIYVLDNLFESLGSKKKSPLFLKFLKFLAFKHRLNVLRDIAQSYQNLYEEHENIRRVEVTCIHPLTDEMFRCIQETLRKMLQASAVVLNVSIDPSLLGGMIFNIGPYKMDSSLRTKLKSLQTRMKEGV